MKKSNKDKKCGFTIVELLVVIVVIGILAAITIVAYAGITARANTTSAVTAANNISTKAEVYNADGPTNTYPATLAALTGAASTTSYYISGVTFSGTLLAAAPTSPSVVNFFKCGTNGTATPPVAPATNITIQSGLRIGYWNYTSSAIAYDDTGIVSGNYLTFPVACLITAS